MGVAGDGGGAVWIWTEPAGANPAGWLPAGAAAAESSWGLCSPAPPLAISDSAPPLGEGPAWARTVRGVADLMSAVGPESALAAPALPAVLSEDNGTRTDPDGTLAAGLVAGAGWLKI